MLATGSLMGATTAVRTGAACLEVWCKRAPELLRTGLEAWEPPPEGCKAEQEFRQGLVDLAQEATKAALDEMQRGLTDLDLFTRPDAEASTQFRRRSRVKR